MFKVEKNVPIPAAGKREGLTGTLRTMQVGDSLVIPVNLQTSIYTTAKLAGCKVRVRSEKAGFVRVWVTEKIES